MLYKGDKGVDVSAHPPKGGPAEAGRLLALRLPKNDRLKLGEREAGESRTRAEARALLDYVAHRPT